jgi:NAD(P)-dependent dehydrogenase (short-subunit alcohol dehydrogenase family)
VSAKLLDDRAIVITGAGAGLGRAYARALAKAGAHVVVNDVNEAGLRSVADEIAKGGGSVAVQVGSVADWDGARALVDVCVERFGKIDGLVNNAAVQHAASPLEENEARLRRIVEVNVLGSLFPAIHAFRVMAEQGHGRILNVTSGAHVGLPGLTAYGTTKGAVASLTYNLAIEGASVGVQVNALAPVAQTAMSPVEERKDGVSRPAPEQIAPAVVYLMSDAAKDLNGQVVRYDGRSVSLLAQPHFETIRVTEDIDTPEGITRAFESTLSANLARVGFY